MATMTVMTGMRMEALLEVAVTGMNGIDDVTRVVEEAVAPDSTTVRVAHFAFRLLPFCVSVSGSRSGMLYMWLVGRRKRRGSFSPGDRDRYEPRARFDDGMVNTLSQ